MVLYNPLCRTLFFNNKKGVCYLQTKTNALPFNNQSSLPYCNPHIFMVLSSDAETIFVPSGLYEAERT